MAPKECHWGKGHWLSVFPSLCAFGIAYFPWRALDSFDVYAALYSCWVWRKLESIPTHSLSVP